MDIETIIESFINGQYNQAYEQFKEFDLQHNNAVDEFLNSEFLNDADKLKYIGFILHRVEKL